MTLFSYFKWKKRVNSATLEAWTYTNCTFILYLWCNITLKKSQFHWSVLLEWNKDIFFISAVYKCECYDNYDVFLEIWVSERHRSSLLYLYNSQIFFFKRKIKQKAKTLSLWFVKTLLWHIFFFGVKVWVPMAKTWNCISEDIKCSIENNFLLHFSVSYSEFGP